MYPFSTQGYYPTARSVLTFFSEQRNPLRFLNQAIYHINLALDGSAIW